MQLPTVFSSLLLLGGLVAAAPFADVEEQCDERIICIDAINACGIKYGGCYDTCKVSAKPVAPPCPATATRISTKITQLPTRTPVPSSTKKASSTTKRSLTTSTRRATPTSTRKASTTTKKVTPTSTKKPTKSTKKPFTTSKPTSKPSSTCNGSGLTVCWDGINECGQMYGACFPDCKPWPTPSAPPCKLTTTKLIPIPGGPTGIPAPTDYPILTVAQE